MRSAVQKYQRMGPERSRTSCSSHTATEVTTSVRSDVLPPWCIIPIQRSLPQWETIRQWVFPVHFTVSPQFSWETQERRQCGEER